MTSAVTDASRDGPDRTRRAPALLDRLCGHRPTSIALVAAAGAVSGVLWAPVYLVEGEHEARGRVVPAREWFDALEAPTKRWIELPRSGHRSHVEQPELFAEAMRSILADTR